MRRHHHFSLLTAFTALQKGTVPAFVYDFYEARPGNQAPAHFTVHVAKRLNFVLRFVVQENPA